MKQMKVILGIAAVWAVCAPALADVFSDYEDLSEGFLGATATHNGVTYRDVNNVAGSFPDGSTFVAGDLGDQVIIERAVPLYADFPSYGSPNNGLTFGTSFVVGDNLTIGALADVWMDLDAQGSAASFDIAYYENGPWGGIEYRLDALSNGSVVASDSFVISDLGGRDNPTFRTMSVNASAFDTLHLYAWLNGGFSGPRGIIDNLSITAVPEPASMLLLGLMGTLVARRRR